MSVNVHDPHSRSLGECIETVQRSLSKACQALQRTHDTNTPHRKEHDGNAQKRYPRVKEGTATAMNQSGLLEPWWDCAMGSMTRQQIREDLVHNLTDQ